MFTNNDPFAAYQQSSVEARAASANQHDLVRMLLEACLDELTKIEGHIDNRRIAEKGASVDKCLNIIMGMDAMLDMENGGELAANLHQLYDFCHRQLLSASINSDTTKLAPIVQVITDINDGWQHFE
ncbi:flagellar export chaperone FliS [Ferrimonas lipolytica]|uniref:Flagellar secretion chaperone FliS n=1 Tax=Ferrimonas lipolytica TaxID=2724191 RepID=A0A6H1UDY0_9GAMM|nr:flagellar export chaperone FliS [Ferrimonas lipolytica]QIZ76800.1 flagellar export chaperone FliS [Ferrimonas lipolytica]